MNLCPRGHDKDTVGLAANNRCRECMLEDKRVWSAKRHRERMAEREARETADARRKKNAQRMREARAAARAAVDAVPIPGVVVDGWEDEFGEVPAADPGLVDWVVALRASQAASAARVQAGEGPPIVQRDPGRPDRLRSGIEGVSRSGLTPAVRSW